MLTRLHVHKIAGKSQPGNRLKSRRAFCVSQRARPETQNARRVPPGSAVIPAGSIFLYIEFLGAPWEFIFTSRYLLFSMGEWVCAYSCSDGHLPTVAVRGYLWVVGHTRGVCVCKAIQWNGAYRGALGRSARLDSVLG